MEKIQSALAKARAARQDPPAARPSPREGAAPESAPEVTDGAAQAEVQTDEAAVAAAWGALREVRVDPNAMARAHVVTLVGGPASAAFDVLRTKLLHQARAQGWRRIAITSPGSACGKSTIALNLAFGLSRQAELRVILAEADLRRPTLARTLGIRAAEGTAEVLEGGAEPGAVMLRHRANLGILTAPGPRRSPAELLGSPRAGAALEALEAAYQPTLTIFDMPPMIAGDDVMAFMGQMDAALIVAAAGSTSIKEIDGCERELATRTNVMGVVLNKCRYLEREADYAQGY